MKTTYLCINVSQTLQLISKSSDSMMTNTERKLCEIPANFRKFHTQLLWRSASAENKKQKKPTGIVNHNHTIICLVSFSQTDTRKRERERVPKRRKNRRIKILTSKEKKTVKSQKFVVTPRARHALDLLFLFHSLRNIAINKT